MIDRTREGDVLAGFCHNGSVAACFMFSLLNAFAADQEQVRAGGRRRLIEYHDTAGPYIHDNRCRIAKYFLEETDKQWLWMLDNDMEFPPDTLHRLLDIAEGRDMKIVAAAYWNCYGQSDRCLSWLMFIRELGIKALPELPDSMEPLELSAAGMGCTLIHRDVLQDVSDMYDGDVWPTFGADTLVYLKNGDFLTGRVPEDWTPALRGREVVKTHVMGEDVSFCIRARRAGYSTFGIPSVVVDHFKPHFLAHGRDSAEAPSQAPKEAFLNAAV